MRFVAQVLWLLEFPDDQTKAGREVSLSPRLIVACYFACYLKSAFWYSRFSFAMNFTEIPFGQAAWHS